MIEYRSFIKEIKPYKPGKPIEEVIRELGLEGEIIKLASNENPLGPSPLAVKAIQATAAKVNIYPDDNCFYLKNKMTEKFKIDADRMIIGSGSVELIELIFKAYVSPGDEVIMSDPSFIMYRIACQIFGGKRIAIPLNAYQHDIDLILKAISKKTKIVIVDNPINPTGTIIRRKSFEKLIKGIPANVITVIDEAYQEYIKDPDYPSACDYLDKYPNLLVLHTFSKIFGLAGLRVGNGFSSEEIIGTMMKVRLPFNVNLIAQIAASAAIDDQDFINRSLRNNEEGKKFLYQEFKKIKLDFTETYGNFVLAHFKKPSREIFEAAQRQGIIIRTVMEYGLPNSLRITVGTPDQNQQLVKVLAKIL